MDVTEHFAAVWAHKFLLIVVALWCGIAVFGVRSLETPTYEASSRLQARVPATDTGDAPVDAGYYAETVTGLVVSPAVVEDALAEADLEGDPAEVADEVGAEVAEQPGFVVVTAQADSGRDAALLADALVTVVALRVAEDQANDLNTDRATITTAIADIEQELAGIDPADTAARAPLEQEREALIQALRENSNRPAWRVESIVDAETPSSPIAPVPWRDGLLAALLGLILAAEGVVVFRSLRGSLSSRDPARDAGRVAGVPGVGMRSRDSAGVLVPLLPPLDGIRSVVVVHRGPDPDSRAVLLLADLLAARGRSVLVVDLSPDRPSLPSSLGVEPPPSFGGLPKTDAALRQAMKRTQSVGDVRVLPAGGGEQLAPAELDTRLARVVAAAGVDVVVACTSLKHRDDFFRYAGSAVEAVVLHVERRSSTRRTIRDDADMLRGLSAPMVGVVVSLDRPSSMRRAAGARAAPQRGQAATSGAVRTPSGTSMDPAS